MIVYLVVSSTRSSSVYLVDCLTQLIYIWIFICLSVSKQYKKWTQQGYLLGQLKLPCQRLRHARHCGAICSPLQCHTPCHDPQVHHSLCHKKGTCQPCHIYWGLDRTWRPQQILVRACAVQGRGLAHKSARHQLMATPRSPAPWTWSANSCLFWRSILVLIVRWVKPCRQSSVTSSPTLTLRLSSKSAGWEAHPRASQAAPCCPCCSASPGQGWGLPSTTSLEMFCGNRGAAMVVQSPSYPHQKHGAISVLFTPKAGVNKHFHI